MSNIKREELALAISDYVLINETPVGTKMYPEDLKLTLGSLLSPKDLIAIMQLIDQYSQGKVDEAVHSALQSCATIRRGEPSTNNMIGLHVIEKLAQLADIKEKA